MNGQDVILSSARAGRSATPGGGKDDWRSPKAVLDAVRFFGGGCIAMDPCTDAFNPVGAANYYDGNLVDGLAMDWPAMALTYVNPPYSQLRNWLAKCDRESQRGVEIIALVPSRTDTRAFHQLKYPSRAAFWRGRLTFGGAPNCAPFASTLFYWGHRGRHFTQTFKTLAKVVTW